MTTRSTERIAGAFFIAATGALRNHRVAISECAGPEAAPVAEEAIIATSAHDRGV